MPRDSLTTIKQAPRPPSAPAAGRAFVIGAAFGAVSQRTHFCTMGALADVFAFGDNPAAGLGRRRRRRGAGLSADGGTGLGVDWLTLESQALPGVHVLGDATFPAQLMPRSGHMANQHAKVAAAVIQRLRGEPVNPAPLVMNTCYSHLSPTRALHVASVHPYDAAGKSFEAVPASVGVSKDWNTAEALYAQAWAENIWADALAL